MTATDFGHLVQERGTRSFMSIAPSEPRILAVPGLSRPRGVVEPRHEGRELMSAGRRTRTRCSSDATIPLPKGVFGGILSRIIDIE